MSDKFDETMYKLLDNCDTYANSDTSNVNSIQLREQRHPTTGLMHSIMTRTSSKNFLFAMELPAMEGEEPYNKVTFSGTKESSHSFAIYAVNSCNDKVVKVGSLTRIQMGMYNISYVLKNIEDMPMIFIAYHVPSPFQTLRSPPSRYAEVAIHVPSKLPDKNEATTSESRNDRTAKKFLLLKKIPPPEMDFGKLCLKHVKKHHNLSDVVEVDPTITIFHSLKPYVNPRTGRSTLHFNGRGKYASPKNMKLIVMRRPEGKAKKKATPAMDSPPPDVTKVFLQICKWEDEAYRIDYDEPITSLHAFAFGLAQIDL